MRSLLWALIGCLQLMSIMCKCPPSPLDLDQYDASNTEPQRGDANSCEEIDARDRVASFETVKNRLKVCAGEAKLGSSDRTAGVGDARSKSHCQFQVVNLGLEKTGTSEVANLLRLLHVQNMSFASPRGAASG